jgi:hypothetical protein
MSFQGDYQKSNNINVGIQTAVQPVVTEETRQRLIALQEKILSGDKAKEVNSRGAALQAFEVITDPTEMRMENEQ